MLQELLNLGLVDIGPDDSRFAKIEAAGAALVEHLRSHPTLIIPMALIAIDCDADEADPVFTLVEDQVIEQWKTMRNTHVNRPRELLRSIIIHALSLLAEGSPEMAALIWQTTVSPLNHGQARLGKEAELVRDLLQNFGKQAEDEAAAKARLVAPTSKKRRAKQTADATSEFALKPYAPLKDAALVTDVARSAGPQYPGGTPLESPNPQWPNTGQPWALAFTPLMTAALIKAVNLGMQRIFAPLGESLQSYLEGFEERLADFEKAGQQARQIRLDVLWWSEARYSPSLARGYREMQGEAAAVAMAHDLSQLVPAMAPASVTYVLGEAVVAISPKDSKPEPRSVETLLDALRASGSDLRELLPGITTNNGRVPLIELIAEAVGGDKIPREDVRGKTGVDPALELSLPDFAMWTFRDIQARRLVEELK